MAVATPTPVNAVPAPQRSRASIVLGMLWRDKFATVAVIFLLLVILCAIIGPAWLGDAAVRQNLRGRNAPPFSLRTGLALRPRRGCAGPAPAGPHHRRRAEHPC